MVVCVGSTCGCQWCVVQAQFIVQGEFEIFEALHHLNSLLLMQVEFGAVQCVLEGLMTSYFVLAV